MHCTSTNLSYEQTGYFSKIIMDYLKQDKKLQPFYEYAVSIAGIKAAIGKRKQYPTDRKLLVEVLKKQYANVTLSAQQQLNIEQLSTPNCFTITTAHQPNIFTGHLYFIYKILHAVKLAEDLHAAMPENNFVPVFYLGSEDADLDELGHIYLAGEKYEWKTTQTGAVGRLKVDKALVQLIERISGQLTVYPFGKEIIDLLKDCYKAGSTIEQATFKLIHELFGEYGVVVLSPDNAELKREFIPVVEKELTTSFSYKAVQETATLFPREYKVQASGREINLFYLAGDLRERIVNENSKFKIQNSSVEFDDASIKTELLHHPEKFSSNVILRPVFQEMILPNIAFIGGGGEIAYWLELKKVFEEAGVPFPVLVLRNSFMIVNKELNRLREKLQFSIHDLFKTEDELINELVKRESSLQLNLDKEKQAVAAFYGQLKSTVTVVDTTLQRHTDALLALALKKIEALEKKMLRAEKKKFGAQQRQLYKLHSQLFPNNSLQERIENVLPYYAKFGKDFINMVYDNSSGLEQQFVILEE